ncbi:Uncharacterised protein [Mycobacteroides abscessus subsp. abscessus]|nr:Uncharacterised protein [Mycobacteroides abscessus subsp. abscessus]
MKLGARFSAKARGPSLASLLVKTPIPTLVSALKASFSCMPSESRMVLRTAWTARGPLPAIILASSSAFSRA